ncbi:MAG: aspartate/glutamate racemase family protein [Candidatus Bathyarchaeia archaeon]
MRIKIINPNTSELMTKAIDAAARQYKRHDTEITTVSLKFGSPVIDSYYDEALASAGILEEIKKGQRENFDGFIIACFSDPALQASREISTAPVVGIGEASMLLACTIAYKFAILSMPKSATASMRALLTTYGLESRCASIRMVDVSVSKLETGLAEIKKLFLQEARKAIDEGAETILLGCAGLSGLDKEFEKELGVPTIDGVVAAVKLLESLHDYGIKTSKILTYRTPERFQNSSNLKR